ncbi:MAG: diguanylate cyclase [Spirochaetes bacterium]|nr:diguanylate cyclase [Spirochaetota bacterium]MBN2772406.1 diguanylate cyclase [Spirochaetota bacterium]
MLKNIPKTIPEWREFFLSCFRSNFLPSVYVLFAFILSILLFANLCLQDKKESCVAVNGVLDLSSADFANDHVYTLGGQWLFVYGVHITPAEIDNEKYRTAFQQVGVPASWKNQKYKGRALPGTGIATYRLKILIGENAPDELSLLVPGWESAYRLYVNGKLTARAGIAAESSETAVPAWSPRIGRFDVNPGVNDIVVHISNFDHARGGPGMMPFAGNITAITSLREKGVALKLFSFGGLLMISLYHIVIFFLRSKEKSALWFSMFCFTMALRSLVINEHGLLIFFPSIPWNIHVRITYLAFTLALPVFIMLLRSIFKEEINRFAVSVVTGLATFYALMILFASPLVFTEFVVYFQILITVSSIYGLVALFRAMLHKREGAAAFLIAFFFYLICIVNDILFHRHIVPTGYIVPFGFYSFVFIQALILAKRYTTAFVIMEELFSEKTKLEGTALTLRNLSYIDPLTGLANRRRLDEYMSDGFKRAIRAGDAVSVIMIDIDFFKSFNDQNGHVSGDDVLRRVALAIQSCLRRPADLAARYGGEEFALFLPSTGIDGAKAVAENMRTATLELQVPAADDSVEQYVSLSLGCASMKPGPDDDPLQLIRKADQALYRAKEKGRNRVETAL